MKRKNMVLMVWCVVLGAVQACFGLATEQIGPDDAERPTGAQPGWPKGIVEVPRHACRVYSMWCNGNEMFYFQGSGGEISELLALFGHTRMRDHEVRVVPGKGKVRPFQGVLHEYEYNVSLQIVGGIALARARREPGERVNFPLEPLLTVYAGDDPNVLERLEWPENAIIDCRVEGVSIESKRKRPKRRACYGRLEFDDGLSAEERLRTVAARITLWKKGIEGGIGLGKADREGRFSALFSAGELAELREGKSWLTVTTGNWLIEPDPNDQRFPVERLAAKAEKVEAVKAKAPAYYYGRILFEDGSPPVLEPKPWGGAEISVGFSYAGSADLDAEGYFVVTFSDEQLEKLKGEKPRKNVYVPVYEEKNRCRALHVYPVSLLDRDKSEAKVLKIRRPGPVDRD